VFKHSKLALATLVAISGTAALAQTQPATPAQPQQLERVEVTGSNIKRLDKETVAPVEIITREQIERTGQPTAADVLRNLPSNLGSFGESFSNSFAPGAAGISLRGLGQKTTLVLVNGRRTAGYGYAQNLQDTFVDLNAIPSSAIERIDILKDGASAIYGSDAIAGVVNIILRKDYKGAEVRANAGFFEGKNDYRLTGSFGMGDRAASGFNAFGTVDYYQRDELLQSDTEFLKSRDFRNRPGGRNGNSLTGMGTWRALNAAGTAFTNQYRAISECSQRGGTVMTTAEAIAAGLIQPTAANLNPTTGIGGNPNSTFCTVDLNNQLSALPGTKRLNSYGRVTLDLSANATGFAEVALSRTETEQTFTNTFFAGTTGLQQTNAGLRPFTYNVTFGPGASGNPFATPARYNGQMTDLGTRNAQITSTNARVLVGANYTFGDWDLDSGVTIARSDTTTQSLNRLSKSGTSAAFGVSSNPQPPTPTAGSAGAVLYNLDRPSLNSAAVRDQVRANFERAAISDLQMIDTRASTTVGALPGGDIGLGIGFEFRREAIKDRPAAAARAGDILGQGITATDGSRTNTSVYGELSLPFIKDLEAQLALRMDRYSDYGTSTTPKVGVKYRLMEGLLVRANWGKGFRAPTLPEISPSEATFFTSVLDPEDGVGRQVSGVFTGNPKLKAETSKSATVGVVFEPVKDFSVAANWYRIDWRNVVSSKSFQDIIDASCPNGGAAFGNPPCPSTANVLRDTTSGTNGVVTILSNYENLASRVTSGVDLDGSLRLATDFGRITTSANVTYIHSFKEDGVEYVGTNGGSNTIPRTRAGLSVSLDQGALAVTARVNYTHSFYQQALAASWFTPQDPRFQNGVLPARTGSSTTVDLFGRYTFNANLSASLSIINVQNKMPPLDPAWTNLTDISLYDVRGRSIRVGLTYRL
jgi:iron complex outermembrane receptor protein